MDIIEPTIADIDSKIVKVKYSPMDLCNGAVCQIRTKNGAIFKADYDSADVFFKDAKSIAYEDARDKLIEAERYLMHELALETKVNKNHDLIDRNELIKLIDKDALALRDQNYGKPLGISYLGERITSIIHDMPSQSLSDEITDKMIKEGLKPFDDGVKENLKQKDWAIYFISNRELIVKNICKAMQEAREPVEKQWLRQVDVLDELDSILSFLCEREQEAEEKDLFQMFRNISNWVKEQKKPVDETVHDGQSLDFTQEQIDHIFKDA